MSTPTQMISPFIEEENYDDEQPTTVELQTESVMVVDEQQVKPKKEKVPKLSNKQEKYMIFGHWFIKNLIGDDINTEFLLNSLKIKQALNTQQEFYSLFLDNFKDHKNDYKNYCHPKVPKESKKVKLNNQFIIFVINTLGFYVRKV